MLPCDRVRTTRVISRPNPKSNAVAEDAASEILALHSEGVIIDYDPSEDLSYTVIFKDSREAWQLATEDIQLVESRQYRQGEIVELIQHIYIENQRSNYPDETVVFLKGTRGKVLSAPVLDRRTSAFACSMVLFDTPDKLDIALHYIQHVLNVSDASAAPDVKENQAATEA